jgi:hypothetical protein
MLRRTSPSRAREALAARSQMGRWTHTFTRCPVTVAARSEAKSETVQRTRRNTKKGGHWDTKAIRRVSTCLMRRLEAVLFTGGRGVA